MAKSDTLSIHDVRMFNFAIIDILGTFFIGYIIYRYNLLKKLHITSFFEIMIFLFLTAIIIHYLLGISTTLNYFIGLSDRPERSTNNNFLSIYHPK